MFIHGFHFFGNGRARLLPALVKISLQAVTEVSWVIWSYWQSCVFLKLQFFILRSFSVSLGVVMSLSAWMSMVLRKWPMQLPWRSWSKWMVLSCWRSPPGLAQWYDTGSSTHFLRADVTWATLARTHSPTCPPARSCHFFTVLQAARSSLFPRLLQMLPTVFSDLGWCVHKDSSSDLRTK